MVGGAKDSMVGGAQGSIVGGAERGAEGSIVGGAEGSMAGAAPAASPLAYTPSPYTPRPGLGGPGVPLPAAPAAAAVPARKDKNKGGKSTGMDSHFDAEPFTQHKMAIKRSDELCTFTQHPKYDVQLKKPNAFALDWVFSVPCGGPEGGAECTEWIFLNTEDRWGRDKADWVNNYLKELGWTRIYNGPHKRFICPRCGGKEIDV